MNGENRVLRNIEFRPLRTGIICGGIFGVFFSFVITPIILLIKGIEVSFLKFAIRKLVIVLIIQLLWLVIYLVKYRET